MTNCQIIITIIIIIDSIYSTPLVLFGVPQASVLLPLSFDVQYILMCPVTILNIFIYLRYQNVSFSKL
jgi:hypothetical protein